MFDPVDRPWLGFALETLVFHELRGYNHAQGKNRPLAFYRTASGVEVDFVIETQRGTTGSTHIVAIEVKLATKWERKWERPLRSLSVSEGIHVDRMIGVYTGARRYHFDGLDVLPLGEFLRQLHAGEVF